MFGFGNEDSGGPVDLDQVQKLLNGLELKYRVIPEKNAITLSFEADNGDVSVHLPTGGTRFFQKNADGSYAASPGDYGRLSMELGRYRLTEQDGTVLAFRTDWALDYVQDTNGNRITCVLTISAI